MNKTSRTTVSPTLRHRGDCALDLPQHSHPSPSGHARLEIRARRFLSTTVAIGSAACALLMGCATPRPAPLAEAAPAPDPQTLRAGDVIKITFPRTPALDSTQQIRRDGLINLSIVGEVTAANLSPAALEQQLLERYASELVSKEVRVTVVSSAFAVFVTGAVVHPGKLTPDRPLTAFEAVMESGGFDSVKADSKAVTIIRQESGQTKNFTVNLKAVLDGKDNQPFYLKAYDVVYVPEKFSWF